MMRRPAARRLIDSLACSAAVSTLLTATSGAAAATAGDLLGGELRLQGGTGGDAAPIREAEAFEGELPELRLGDHFFIGLGVIVAPWRSDSGVHALEAELLGGFASWSTGKDATADRLTTFGAPLDLLGFYRYAGNPNEQAPWFVRAGAGLTYRLGSGIGSFGRFSGIDYDIADALGYVVEASTIYAAVGAGLRYTWLTSKIEATGEEVDMSSIAAFVNIILEPGADL